MQSKTLTGKARDNLMTILNHALEEEVVLSVTMRGFLNNITGPNFHSLYRLFGDQCRQIDRWLGEISARARGMGVVARAGASEVTRAARDSVGPPGALPPRNMIGELLVQHEGIADRLRADLAACSSDASTAELLKRLVEFHETAAWMLQMVLDGPEVPRSGA
ncbi:MAG TPA: ferritin-like domain-containing protein [Opitutaceae bacterium]|nr:ferritin-like domain-containing protein [Opitutaceae bacterium]